MNDDKKFTTRYNDIFFLHIEMEVLRLIGQAGAEKGESIYMLVLQAWISESKRNLDNS